MPGRPPPGPQFVWKTPKKHRLPDLVADLLNEGDEVLNSGLLFLTGGMTSIKKWGFSPESTPGLSGIEILVFCLLIKKKSVYIYIYIYIYNRQVRLVQKRKLATTGKHSKK